MTSDSEAKNLSDKEATYLQHSDKGSVSDPLPNKPVNTRNTSCGTER